MEMHIPMKTGFVFKWFVDSWIRIWLQSLLMIAQPRVGNGAYALGTMKNISILRVHAIKWKVNNRRAPAV